MNEPLNQPSYPAFPIYKLTEEEIMNPYLVLDEFFRNGNLTEIREKLWEFFKVMITGKFPEGLDAEEKTLIICLHEAVEKLVEAAHLINEENEKRHLNIDPKVSNN